MLLVPVTGLLTTKKTIMEYQAMQNLKNITSDKSTLRQWHVKLLNAIRQVKREYAVVVEDTAKNIDLGKQVDAVMQDMETTARSNSSVKG